MIGGQEYQPRYERVDIGIRLACVSPGPAVGYWAGVRGGGGWGQSFRSCSRHKHHPPLELSRRFSATNDHIPGTITIPPLGEVLCPGKWPAVENSVDRALDWLASQQAANGSFPTQPAGQPAVTSLCVLAFLARGHQPGLGPYGKQIERGIDFVLACQMDDGLFSSQPPKDSHGQDAHEDLMPSHTAVYNHAISGLMLGEVFGHVSGARMQAAKKGLIQALQFTRTLQTQSKEFAADRGGWRYLHLRYDRSAADSDLSVTAWQILFLRSARNAEFNVPQAYVDEATEFVERCWDEKHGVFNYAIEGGADARSSRGMVGAGILCLSLAGRHQTPEALKAGDWLLAHPFRKFGERIGVDDGFFYSAYYCSQAAAQLGGKYLEGDLRAAGGHPAGRATRRRLVAAGAGAEEDRRIRQCLYHGFGGAGAHSALSTPACLPEIGQGGRAQS